MKQLKRQDRNGLRKASDIEQKYKLGQINYTAQEIEDLKKKITVDSSLSTSSSNAVENQVITHALNNKVNKETGKGLSSNDFTDDEKNKLEQIEANANKYVLPEASEETLGGVKLDGTTIYKNADGKISSKQSISISLLDVYPIGSIYMNVNEVNPTGLFGGTWEALETETTYYMWQRLE